MKRTADLMYRGKRVEMINAAKATLASFAILAAMPAVSWAGVVTFNFSGVVDSVFDPSGVAPIGVGDPFSGYFTFDDSVPNIRTGPAGPSGSNETGEYRSLGPEFGASFSLGGETFDVFGEVAILLSRFLPTGCCGIDASNYFMTAFDFAEGQTFRISLQTSNMNRGLPDNSLPLTPPDLSLFENKAVLFVDRQFGMEGTLTELTLAEAPEIPEPASLPVIGAGVGLLAWYRRRSRVGEGGLALLAHRFSGRAVGHSEKSDLRGTTSSPPTAGR